MAHRVLLLAPSRGLGGGIERYVETIEWSFDIHGIEFRRIDLDGAGAAAHLGLLREYRAQTRGSWRPTRVVVAHPVLLPLAAVVARDSGRCGVSLICHGTDVWGSRLRARWLVESKLMRSSAVRVVAVSSFTAGAVFGDCAATILPPGLSRDWFQTLVDASATIRPADRAVELVTSFRLSDWREKGLPEVLQAVGALGSEGVQVVVCGTGHPPADLIDLIRRHPWCTLRPGLTNGELAYQFASADVCVLATRTRRGSNAYGEGFGLVLLEAQVAGTPVIGPAYGGSHGAYIEGITGLSPIDETAESLAAVLGDLLRDRSRLMKMGVRAAEWAREAYAPEVYAQRVLARLL